MSDVKNIFECADDITKKLFTNFRSIDTKEKIFFKTTNEQIFARTEKQLIIERHSLSENIYYYPTYFPLISIYDIRAGTAWNDWSITNFDNLYHYEEKNNQIIINEITRNKISLEQYIEQLKVEIDNNITKIFKKCRNKTIFLAYSSGIDSLCILSFLIKKKLQNRIKLINITNVMTHNVKRTFEKEKKLGFDVYHLEININDLTRIINENSYKKVLCYTTYMLFKKFPNSTFIFGFHGNQSLLHKNIFLEQIQKEVYKTGYCKSLDGWKPKKNPTPLKEHFLYRKPWHELQGCDGCEWFDPLFNEKIFEMIRSIDWKNIDSHIVSNAEVARKIINENVGNLLDDFITYENLNEIDNISGDLEVPFKNLQKEIFNVDKNYCNKQGHDWLMSEYNQSLPKKFIKLNTLLSFLVQKFISRVTR